MVTWTRKHIPADCPTCRKGGYAVGANELDGRPRFTCGHCGSTWTCGHKGGEYLSSAGLDKFVEEFPGGVAG